MNKTLFSFWYRFCFFFPFHFNFGVKQFIWWPLMVFSVHFTNRRNGTQLKKESIIVIMDFIFLLPFFSMLYLKWIPTGMEFPSWRWQWNWRVLHTETAAWFWTCFLFISRRRMNFSWLCTKPHGWGCHVRQGPSQGKQQRENELFSLWSPPKREFACS